MKTTPFLARTVSLKDQFLDWTDFRVSSPFKLLNPTRKRHNGTVYEIENNNLHYTAFKVSNQQEITVDQKVTVSNQFGQFEIEETFLPVERG